MNDRAIGWITMATLVATTAAACVNLPSDLLTRLMPTPMRSITLRHAGLPVERGDPVLAADSSGVARQCGYVVAADPRSVTLVVPRAAPTRQFEFHRTRGSLAEATSMLLPPHKREMVAAMIARWGRAHARRVVAQTVPVIESAVSRCVPMIQSAMAQSLRQRDDEVRGIADRFRRDVINQRLVPLARERLLPIVRRHTDQPARVIGRQLWDRASLWGFAWRAVLDTSRLSDEDLVAREWNRFVDEEAVPVLEQNAELIAETIRQIILDAAADPTLRGGLAEAAYAVASDAPTQTLVRDVLREAIVENDSLRQLWRETLTSPEAMKIFDAIGRDIEPVAREVGDVILGTADGGISEGLTRVLRSQVLGRDRRWIVARESGEQTAMPTPATLKPATNPGSPPPIHFLGS